MKRMPKVVLIIDEVRGAGRQYLQGIADYARLNGPWIFFKAPPFYLQAPGSKTERLDAIKKWGADGIITLDIEDLPVVETLHLPIIVSKAVSSEKVNFPYIDADNLAIGKMAADYYIQKGFRNFAYCGFESFPWSTERAESFEKEIHKAGFEVYFYQKSPSTKPAHWEDHYAELSVWLESLPKPIAVLACNDDRGRQVLDACRIADIRVPQEVAVLGVDNDTLVCSLSFCQLSSIEVNFTKAGFEAAQVLAALMAGKENYVTHIAAAPVSVITRQSSDILAIADSDVAEAMHYITAKIKTHIDIKDVCDHLHIARRTLYQKFIDCLGYTVHEAIAKICTEEISKVLLDTTLPVSKIAVMFNFSSPKHISRFFSKQTGISPSEYRKRNQHSLPHT